MTDTLLFEKISQSNHDLKNIMTSINAYSQLIKRRLKKGEIDEVTALMDKLAEQIARLSEALVDHTELVKKI